MFSNRNKTKFHVIASFEVDGLIEESELVDTMKVRINIFEEKMPFGRNEDDEPFRVRVIGEKELGVTNGVIVVSVQGDRERANVMATTIENTDSIGTLRAHFKVIEVRPIDKSISERRKLSQLPGFLQITNPSFPIVIALILLISLPILIISKQAYVKDVAVYLYYLLILAASWKFISYIMQRKNRKRPISGIENSLGN